MRFPVNNIFPHVDWCEGFRLVEPQHAGWNEHKTVRSTEYRKRRLGINKMKEIEATTPSLSGFVPAFDCGEKEQLEILRHVPEEVSVWCINRFTNEIYVAFTMGQLNDTFERFKFNILGDTTKRIYRTVHNVTWINLTELRILYASQSDDGSFQHFIEKFEHEEGTAERCKLELGTICCCSLQWRIRHKITKPQNSIDKCNQQVWCVAISTVWKFSLSVCDFKAKLITEDCLDHQQYPSSLLELQCMQFWINILVSVRCKRLLQARFRSLYWPGMTSRLWNWSLILSFATSTVNVNHINVC